MTTTLPYTVICHRDDPEWTKHRMNHIGSSVSPSLLLDGPDAPGYCSNYSAFQDYVLGVKNIDNERMRGGNFLEEGIAAWVGHELASPVQPFQCLIRSTRYPWLGATPDNRITIDGTSMGLSIKLTQDPTGWNVKRGDKGPPYAWIQCQHEMLVTDERRMILGGCIGGARVVPIEVERDDDFCERLLLPATKDFWECVQSHRTPGAIRRYPDPDSTDATRKAILALFPAPDPEIEIELDMADLDCVYVEVVRRLEEDTAKRQHIRNTITKALLEGNASRGRIPGQAVWRLGGNGLTRKELDE